MPSFVLTFSSVACSLRKNSFNQGFALHPNYFAFRFFSRLARWISLYSRMSSSSEEPQSDIIASSSFAAARMASISALRLRLCAGIKKPKSSPIRRLQMLSAAASPAILEGKTVPFRFNSHGGPASAANASGFLQVALSEATRRRIVVSPQQYSARSLPIQR